MDSIDITIKKIGNHKAKIAIITSSTFGKILTLENEFKISYKTLGIHFKDIGGQSKYLVFGVYKKTPVVLVSRVYFYETGKIENMLKLFQILKKIGVGTVILTTVTGAINTKYENSNLMLIETHINLTGINPLVNLNPIKFLDMTDCYDRSLRELASQVAESKNIKLCKGTHLQVTGTTYETIGEIRMYRLIGADTVSMSTALDCICARYFGMKVLGFACIVNKSADNSLEPLTNEEVSRNIKYCVKNVSTVVKGVLEKIKFE